MPSRVGCTADTEHCSARGRLDQLLGAAARLAADVKMVAHQVQERLVAHELRRPVQGLAISAAARADRRK